MTPGMRRNFSITQRTKPWDPTPRGQPNARELSEDVREILARFARSTLAWARCGVRNSKIVVSHGPSSHDGIIGMAPHWPRGVPHGDAKGRVAKRSESAGRKASHSVAAGNESVPENPLKVETRVQIPLGLRRSEPVSSVTRANGPHTGPAAYWGRHVTSCRPPVW
jgi:hypothetical protein